MFGGNHLKTDAGVHKRKVAYSSRFYEVWQMVESDWNTPWNNSLANVDSLSTFPYHAPPCILPHGAAIRRELEE